TELADLVPVHQRGRVAVAGVPVAGAADFVRGKEDNCAESVALKDGPRGRVEIETAVVEREHDAFAGERPFGFMRGAPFLERRAAVSGGREMGDLFLEARGIKPVTSESFGPLVGDPVIHEDR